MNLEIVPSKISSEIMLIVGHPLSPLRFNHVEPAFQVIRYISASTVHSSDLAIMGSVNLPSTFGAL